ncbi:hypothetical protein ACWDUL_21150 [Nocardia niigatensis]
MAIQVADVGGDLCLVVGVAGQGDELTERGRVLFVQGFQVQVDAVCQVFRQFG